MGLDSFLLFPSGGRREKSLTEGFNAQALCDLSTSSGASTLSSSRGKQESIAQAVNLSAGILKMLWYYIN
jgi:hypothetical protein